MTERAQESCEYGNEISTCTNIVSQYADVSVPLKLKPYAIVGNISTECYGEPTISMHSCQYANGSCGCEITITQCLCIKIPLEYGTCADVGEAISNCKKATNCSNNCANNCANLDC